MLSLNDALWGVVKVLVGATPLCLYNHCPRDFPEPSCKPVFHPDPDTCPGLTSCYPYYKPPKPKPICQEFYS